MKQKLLVCLLLITLVFFISGCSNSKLSNTATIDEIETVTQTTKKDSEINTKSKIESTTVLEETTVSETTSVKIPETTQNTYEETQNESYDKYVGLWEYSIGENDIDGVIKLGVFSIDENSAVISFSKVSANYAHIAGIGNLSVSVTNGNRIELSFTDNFDNKCSGYAELNDDKIYIKIDIDEANQPFIFGSNVDVTLSKKSDKVSREDFI